MLKALLLRLQEEQRATENLEETNSFKHLQAENGQCDLVFGVATGADDEGAAVPQQRDLELCHGCCKPWRSGVRSLALG